MSFGTIFSIGTIWEQPEYQVEDGGENTETMDICQLANFLSHFLSNQFANSLSHFLSNQFAEKKQDFLSLQEAALRRS